MNFQKWELVSGSPGIKIQTLLKHNAPGKDDRKKRCINKEYPQSAVLRGPFQPPSFLRRYKRRTSIVNWIIGFSNITTEFNSTHNSLLGTQKRKFYKSTR